MPRLLLAVATCVTGLAWAGAPYVLPGLRQIGVPGLIQCESQACRCDRAVTADADDAETLCGAAIADAAASAGDRAQALRARAELRVRARRYDDAIADASAALAVWTKSGDSFETARSYLARGNARLQRGDDAAAFADLDGAVDSMPNVPEFRALRGFAALSADRAAAARADFDAAIEGGSSTARGMDLVLVAANDDRADAYWGRGLVHLFAGQYDDAAADLTESLSRKPGAAAIWLHYARLRQGRDDKAELAANAAKLPPKSREAAILAMFEGDATDARVNDIASGLQGSDGACEGILAIAEWNRFARHDDATAARAYRAVAGICPRSPDVAFAKSALANLPR
jgi:tetratricopeptide (TPR) repeat protein